MALRISGLSPHLRGHLLLFEQRAEPAFDARTGLRLLLTALFLESVRLAALRWLYPSVPLGLLLPLLLGFALLAGPLIAGVRLAHLGLRRWSDWTTTEKSYLVQVIVIANLTFMTLFASRLASRMGQAGIAWTLWTGFLPYVFFGFYQELVYRGMVQLELVRRWGAPAGIIVANVLYTFGPLHLSYFSSRASVAAPMFASIFVIGLFFGVLYRRSGNLWIIAIFHAIGNAYIVASLGRVPGVGA